MKHSHFNQALTIQSSPHIRSGASVDAIMRNVMWALLPTSCFAVYIFGLVALLTLITAMAACWVTEYGLSRANDRANSLDDGSVLVTGLLYGLTLPPGLPLWMVAMGGVIAVSLGKYLFGGLGYNVFNPALVGRAFLQAAFPSAMTTWTTALADDRFTHLPSSVLTLPFAKPIYDSLSGATPLAAMKFEHQFEVTPDLLLGFTAGSVGETSALLILLGGAWLVYRKMMNWRIPAALFVTVAAMSSILHWMDPAVYPGPLFMLFSGGLMLGAVFMATDMVASPNTVAGAIFYGALIGILIVVIRLWGGMPEGVMYAILLANAVSPHLDRLVKPRVFGTRKK